MNIICTLTNIRYVIKFKKNFICIGADLQGFRVK